MSHPVITVDGLGKEYVIGANDNRGESFREMLTSSLSAPYRRFRKLSGDVAATERIWALKDVSFTVNQGEVVGVIGRNGAGKSTLLKILSRITAPTEGRVALRGRVASLLEVGTGFHPELTGRENIFLNGAILGMGRIEIEGKLEQIVGFSGVERFLDTPVKRFSSGMYVRLAFAVAAHLEPEILIVDEILAVGDAEFQRRCLGKMGDVARGGRTVLFVSHNMSAIRALCGRCIVMKAGSVDYDGDSAEAVEFYLSDIEANLDARTEWTWSGTEAPGNGEFHVRRVSVKGDRSNGAIFRRSENITVAVEYDQTKEIRGMALLLRLLTLSGEVAFATLDQAARNDEVYPPGRYRSSCVIPANLLNRREYIIRLDANVARNRILLPTTDVGRIVIGEVGGEDTGSRNWPGVVCPKIDWQITQIRD